MSAASRKVKERTAGINADIESSLSGMRVARAFHNEAYEMEKFNRGNQQYRYAKRDFYREMGIFMSGLDFLTSLMNVAVIALGGFLIMRGRFNYIDLITFSLYVGAFLQPIRRLSGFVEQYTVGMAGFQRFQELLAVPPDIADAPGAHELTGVRGEVEFRDVTFSYDQGVRVLSGVNLHIPGGENPGAGGALRGPEKAPCVT